MNLNSLQNIFSEIDEDNTGMITPEELEKALKRIGKETSAQEINQIIHNWDYLGNGKINYSEFLAATVSMKDVLTEDHISHLFLYFDTDNTGYISRENIKEVFEKKGRNISEAEIDEIMQRHDKAKNGVLDREEFKQMLLENIEIDFSYSD